MRDQRIALAVDLGGTKLATALIDQTGTVINARQSAVCKANVSATADQVAREAAEAVCSAGIGWDAVCSGGVIVPGFYRAEDDAAWAPNLWGDRLVPLAGELRGRLPVPMHIDSDRAGYVLGERWMGVARDLTHIVFLAIGTGIGAGIISGGRLVRGVDGIAGAVGWFALNPQFQEIYGRLGCWEAEAAGPALARLSGRCSAEQAADAARQGDRNALRAFEGVASYLAMGIANMISVLNPQIVVLGGGLMHAADLLLEPIRRTVARWAQPHAAARARIELSALGDRAGLFGAAALAFSLAAEPIAR